MSIKHSLQISFPPMWPAKGEKTEHSFLYGHFINLNIIYVTECVELWPFFFTECINSVNQHLWKRMRPNYDIYLVGK